MIPATIYCLPWWKTRGLDLKRDLNVLSGADRRRDNHGVISLTSFDEVWLVTIDTDLLIILVLLVLEPTDLVNKCAHSFILVKV